MVFSSISGRMSSGMDTYRPSSTGTYRSSTSKYRQNCTGTRSGLGISGTHTKQRSPYHAFLLRVLQRRLMPPREHSSTGRHERN